MVDNQRQQSFNHAIIKNMFWIFKYLNISNLVEIAHLLRPLDLNGWD
jgi:hypothetical protein